VIIIENQILENIYRRRSIRKYKSEQIQDQELNQIIEAGRFAPSGGNSQTNHFIVIQKAEILNELKELVMQEYSKLPVTENMYKGLKGAILQSQKGHYDFCFNAPTLIIATNLRDYNHAMADCAVALENMMLAATSLNIGSCWINQLRGLADNEVIKSYGKTLDIQDNEIICGGVSLGYPNQADLKCLERIGNKVSMFR